MSLISGILSTHQTIDNLQINKMQSCIKKYNADHYSEYNDQHIYLSCFHQFFTAEAGNDISPIIDNDHGVYYNADIFLYNRNELIDILSAHDKSANTKYSHLGDCLLSYHLYKELGLDFIYKLSGVYTITIYDKKNNHLYLITDHLAQRHIAYTIFNESVYYSTLFSPMLESIGYCNIQLDSEWICAAYSDYTPDTEKIAGRSPYKNIYRIQPGHYADINLSTLEVKTIQYWNPLQDIKILKLQNDSQYKDKLISMLNHTTKSMLRAKFNHGILLSGGLDSSTVASFAAKNLQDQGKKLYSYTQIPESDYKLTDNPIIIENETAMVLHNKESYPNIECKFVVQEDKSCFHTIENCYNIFDEPVKPIINMANQLSMLNAASHDKCSIVFSGQHGNATISYGNITTYISQMLSNGHIFKAFKNANANCKLLGIPRFRFFKAYVKYKKIAKKNKGLFDNVIKQEMLQKYPIESIVQNTIRKRGGSDFDSEEMHHNFTFMPLVFQHMGYYDTTFSLTYNFLALDPTLSKSMIELCLSMPIDCFVKNGKERRAVRDYMKGIVNDAILNDYKRRGRQSADYAFRVNKYWDSIKDSVFESLNTTLLDQFFDRKKVNDILDEINKKEYNMDKLIIAKSAIIASLGSYLINFENNKIKSQKETTYE